MSTLAMVLALQALAAGGVDTRPVFEVWPYEAKRLPDGKVQLSYDLTGLKAGILDTEAASELDEPSLKAFAKQLPQETKVTVDYAGAPLILEVATAREQSAPASSFGDVSSSELAATHAMDRPAGARILPALHPEMPKLWLSLDAVLWKARHANESLLGGLQLASDEGTLGLPMGAKAFWLAVLKASLERAAHSEGDAKEGALLLGAHIAAALKRQGVAMPGLPKSDAFTAALETVSDAIEQDKFTRASTLRSTFSPELKRLELRERALNHRFADSRAGRAATLTLLVILEKDGKLRGAYDALGKLRSAFFGAPLKDELPRWQQIAADLGGPAEAMNDFAEYVSRAQKQALSMPSLLPSASGPIDAQLDELGGPGAENARDEVVIALQEGRLKPQSGEGAPWTSVMDAALGYAVIAPDKSDKVFITRSKSYRERVAASFIAALPAPSTDVDGEELDHSFHEDRRPYSLKVALKVPPVFAVEPSPQLFARLAIAYERLETLLASTAKAATVSGVLPGGARRGANNKAEAQRLRRLFRGLELHVAGQLPTTPEDKEASKVAESFLAQWRSDPDLDADIRFASELRGGGQMLMYGVGRQEVRVRWAGKPRVSFATKEATELLSLDVDAFQHYLTPVLMTGQPHYPGTLPDRAAFRAISDRARREPAAVDAALAPEP